MALKRQPAADSGTGLRSSGSGTQPIAMRLRALCELPVPHEESSGQPRG